MWKYSTVLSGAEERVVEGRPGWNFQILGTCQARKLKITTVWITVRKINMKSLDAKRAYAKFDVRF